MTGMAVNKVIYGGETLIDLSGDTVAADKLLAGYTAHGADGTAINGMYSLTDDSYVWEQYNGDPSVINEAVQENAPICYKMDGSLYSWNKIEYADEIQNVDGELSLVNPTSVQWGGSVSNPDSSVLLGKYVYSNGYRSGGRYYYRIPSDATFTINTLTNGRQLVVSSAVKLTGSQRLQYVASNDNDAYPANGEHTDGYWYVYKGILSDLIVDGDGGSVTLQEKTVTPSESQQAVTPDSGYDGLSKVTVDAVSNTYVGSAVERKSAATYTPGTSNQIISSGQYLSGAQTIKGDANLVADNIKSGVSIFGVTGTLQSGGSGTNNCEAYHITSSSTTLPFQGTGTVKVWGYGYKSGGYTTTVYSFVGDGYYSGSWGTPTKTNATFGLKSDGTLSGLPSGLAGVNLLVTIGI